MKSSTLISLFLLVILLAGNLQMSPMPAPSSASITTEISMDADLDHGMAEMPGCQDGSGCDQQTACAGHLCTGIPSLLLFDLPQAGLVTLNYIERSDSLNPVPQDRPPRFPVI